jgi:putative endopeptidase
MRSSSPKFPYFLVSCTAVVMTVTLGAYAQKVPKQETHGISAADMDTSVKPGDDFYRYANGAWLKRTEIPPDRASVGVFSNLADLSNKRRAALIEELAKSNAPAGSGPRKIADLYNSYMDEAGIEAKGVAPLKPQLNAITAIRDKKELAHALGEGLRADVDPLNNTNFHTDNIFGLWVAPDFNQSEHYTAYLLQGGIELPDRQYYLDDSEHMKKLRVEYQAHVSRMLKLAGFSDPDARAAGILELEHAIAEKHWNLSDDQDIHKANNPGKRSDFAAKAPGLDWDEYFQAAGLSQQENFIVWQPSAFVGESALVASQPLDTWKDLLAYHLLEEYGGMLPKAFVDERFAFFGKALSGTPQIRPRWQRGVNVVNAVLGDEVGKIYAQRFFPPESKARAQAMVDNIKAAFRKRVDALTWMDPATKAEAQAKLNTLYVGIGYPETWHEYEGLEIKADAIFGNLWRSNLFEYHRQVSRLGKPIDRHEWSMTPQTVNAVNLPLQNALNFPAAILEPPFFDAKAPDAANYGAIGVVIGHEISHTFDTEGSTFDDKGALRNWWKPADLEHFAAATQKLAAQYDAYKPFPDLSLNGKQTLAENIADLGGLSASYDGYRAALGNKAAPVQHGFTGDQQFFLAFAQSEKNRIRDAALRQQIMTDEHSPSEYRTAEVRNLDAWYAAFNVKPEDKRYFAAEERVRIW